MVKWLKSRSYVRKFECLYSFNHGCIGKSKFYFFSSGKRKKLKFWGAIVGTKAQICTLGLKPYLLMWIYPRRSKWLKKSQDRYSRKERVEGWSPRRLPSSDRTNISQSSKHSVDSGNLPRDSNNEDKLQTRTKMIRIQKYLREKLPPPH